MSGRIHNAAGVFARVLRRLAAAAHILPGGLLAGLLTGIATLPLLAGGAAAAVPREVYLIQNSGWMQPFYLDPNAPFMPFLHAFIQASALPGAQVTIASFNQAGQVGGRPSPMTLFSGALTEAALAEALGKLDLPHRDGSSKYADADFNGALSATMSNLLSGEAGVIWMVTNNKNSYNNDQHVVENTNRFSTLLAGSEFISSIVAYPLRMPAKGPDFSAKGLVVYGIAYTTEAERWLQQATQAPAMRSLLVAKPVRLKPLAQDPVTLTLAGTGSGGLRLSRANAGSGGAIVIDGLPGGQETRIDLPASLTSTYYPQVIDQAHLQAAWLPADGGPPIAVTITPETISGMGPDETLDGVHIQLVVPPVARAPGLAGLLQGERRLHGLLRLQLTDVRLVLQQAFVDKMRDLFAADADAVSNQVAGARRSQLPAAMPAVFLGHEAVAAAATDVPVSLGIAFSAWPLILLIAAAGVALLLLGALLLACTRERAYSIPVGPDVVAVSLRPFRSTTLRSRAGVRVAVTGRLLGRPKIVPLA